MNNDIFERLKALQEILARKNELEMEILDAEHAGRAFGAVKIRIYRKKYRL